MILVFEEKPKYSRNHGENTIFSQEVQGTHKKNTVKRTVLFPLLSNNM